MELNVTVQRSVDARDRTPVRMRLAPEGIDEPGPAAGHTPVILIALAQVAPGATPLQHDVTTAVEAVGVVILLVVLGGVFLRLLVKRLAWWAALTGARRGGAWVARRRRARRSDRD